MRESAKPPVPTLVTIVAVLLAVTVIGGAFALGRAIGLAGQKDSGSKPGPELAASLPAQLENFALKKRGEPSTGPRGKLVVRGDYTDGTNGVLLVLSNPEEDLEKFLTEAGVVETKVVELPAGKSSDPVTMCGKSTDSNFPACGRILEGTGWMIFATTAVDDKTLIKLLVAAEE